MLVCGKASLFIGWKMLLMKMVTSHLTQTSRDVSSFTHFVEELCGQFRSWEFCCLTNQETNLLWSFHENVTDSNWMKLHIKERMKSSEMKKHFIKQIAFFCLIMWFLKNLFIEKAKLPLFNMLIHYFWVDNKRVDSFTV